MSEYEAVTLLKALVRQKLVSSEKELTSDEIYEKATFEVVHKRKLGHKRCSSDPKRSEIKIVHPTSSSTGPRLPSPNPIEKNETFQHRRSLNFRK